MVAEIAEWNASGVYSITNTATGEQYVGMARRIAARWVSHVSMLRRGKHHCKRLQTAWNEHGEQAFTFAVLEQMPDDSKALKAAERAWIEELQPAYNASHWHKPYCYKDYPLVVYAYPLTTVEEEHMSDQADERQAILPFDDGSAGRIIRRAWHEGRWHFSVIDVVAVLTDSVDPGAYWRKLKQRLSDEEGASETVTNCHRLKMRAIDGKMRETDAADAETMLRIVQSVPSPKAEPIKQWLAREGARRLDDVAAELPEQQKRLLFRGEMADRNRTLADAASLAGVTSSRDFGIFQDFGYRGLYGGETAKDIAARKGLKRGEKILDWMGSDELAANLFRASLTEQKLRNDPTIAGKDAANQAHHDVGAAVRQVILEQGGTAPEQLPTPAQSIQQLERAEQAQAKARLQPPLFPNTAAADDEDPDDAGK